MSYNRKSELIAWSQTLSCGVKLVDEQHKELVELVNELFNHVSGDEEQEHEYFNKVITQLVSYVKVHFVTEEKIMASIKYPGYLAHKRSHESFILKVVDNIRDYQDGKRLTLSSFTKFLKDWILTHIAIMDKNYFEYLKQIATRSAGGRLVVTAANIV